MEVDIMAVQSCDHLLQKNNLNREELHFSLPIDLLPEKNMVLKVWAYVCVCVLLQLHVLYHSDSSCFEPAEQYPIGHYFWLNKISYNRSKLQFIIILWLFKQVSVKSK